MTTLRRYGWTYREVGYAPTYQAHGAVVEVTPADGKVYRTLIDCDVWLDAVEDGARLIALPAERTGIFRLKALLWTLPAETRTALGY